MSIRFRDAKTFWRETLTVTAGAAAVGIAVPLVTGLSAFVAAPAAALLGGSLGAALTRRRPRSSWLRASLGVVGGTLAALGHVALATRFGFGFLGAVAGGALGGLALGSLLASDEDGDRSALSGVVGIAGATVVGAVGIGGLDHIARYAAAEGSPVALTTATMAGLMGLWVAAGAGVRRLEKARDPLVVRAEKLLVELKDPVKARVTEGMKSYAETLALLKKDESIGPAMAEDAEGQARELTHALLETAESWRRVSRDLGEGRLDEVNRKLDELAEKTAASDDPVTLGHLARATQALRAQQSALKGLEVGRSRAEAALDAQVALLDRLRLAVAQHQASDRERFALELSAVSDQVSRLSDDLDSLSAAIAEAESFSDRRALAEVERAGRKALDRLAAQLETSPAEESEEAEEAIEEEAPARR